MCIPHWTKQIPQPNSPNSSLRDRASQEGSEHLSTCHDVIDQPSWAYLHLKRKVMREERSFRLLLFCLICKYHGIRASHFKSQCPLFDFLFEMILLCLFSAFYTL